MDIVYNHVMIMGYNHDMIMGYNHDMIMGGGLYSAVAAADPLPHGFPSRGCCRQTAAPLTLKSVIKEKADYLPIRQRVLKIVN